MFLEGLSYRRYRTSAILRERKIMSCIMTSSGYVLFGSAGGRGMCLLLLLLVTLFDANFAIGSIACYHRCRLQNSHSVDYSTLGLLARIVSIRRVISRFPFDDIGCACSSRDAIRFPPPLSPRSMIHVCAFIVPFSRG